MFAAVSFFVRNTLPLQKPLRRSPRTLTTTLLGVLLCISTAFSPAAKAAPLKVNPHELHYIAHQFFQKRHLGSLLVQIRVDGRNVFDHAEGFAMPGVPVTRDGYFRNGAVAITYVAAIMMKMSSEGHLDMDAPIARWLPNFPEANTVTPRMLANMTAGYPDYVADEGFINAFYKNPFRTWTNDDRIAISMQSPRLFAAGTNWDYSHGGYVILGKVLEAAAGKPLKQLMQDYVIKPMALQHTFSIDTPDIPAPAIHSYTAERGVFEDATFWNPSWTLPDGAVQVTTIDDMARSFDTLIGDTGFLPEGVRAQMLDTRLIGFGKPLDGCRACHTLTRDFFYGLGVFRTRDWAFQSPRFGGYASMVATLPAEHSPTGQRITIAAATTLKANSYTDWKEDLPNRADELTRILATKLAPDNPPAPQRH